MPFQKRFSEIQDKIHTYHPVHLWVYTFIFSFWAFTILLFYNWLYWGQFSLRLINGTAALTAVFLIGLSFALSAVCYFWNFADKLIIYRKNLGLVGFYFASFHAGYLFTVLPITHYLKLSAPFLSGILAFLIFLMMAVISNRYAVHELGGKNWRRLLRVGYLAYIFALFHFFLLDHDDVWAVWSSKLVQGKFTLIPLSLIIFGFGIVVLLLRAALSISLWRKKMSKPKSLNYTPLKTTVLNEV